MGFDKRKIKLVCLVAVACTGKTTYMDGIAGLNDKYPTEEWLEGKRPATLALGQVFRNTLGSGFFKDIERPYAPDITSSMVKQIVHEFIHISYETVRDIIIDGFPRTTQQLEWLLNSSYANMRPVDIEIRFLYTNEEDLTLRREERLAGCQSIPERIALEQRFDCDKESFIKIYEQTKKIIATNKRNNFTMREIEV